MQLGLLDCILQLKKGIGKTGKSRSIIEFSFIPMLTF